MEIKLLQTGPLGVNTFIVPLAKDKVFVVDPASCAYSGDERIVSRYLAQEKLEPLAIVLTHGHFDHVAGLPFLSKTYPDIQIVIHKDDAEMIGADSGRLQGQSLAQMGFYDFTKSVSLLPEPTSFLEANKTLADCIKTDDEGVKVALSLWEVLHTPGHTRGSCCLYNETEKLLISGDTLFFQSWGRTDLYGGSESQIRQSLRYLAKTVTDDTRVYPGHDDIGFLFAENY
ncbi:MAG: MBL fold metallo-hydrolase [Treponema sp.]|nr:MBL fold metallo-hydrolase [Treponema sp.]